jgi:hypothetical protein
MRSYSNGVQYYENALPVLQKYHSLPAFKTIEDQCAKLIAVIRTDLSRCLESTTNQTTTAAEVREAAQLLVAMGSDRALISRQFVSWHDVATSRMMAPLDAPSISADTLRHISGKLTQHIVDMYEAFIDVFVKPLGAHAVGSSAFAAAAKSTTTAATPTTTTTTTSSTTNSPPPTTEFALSWCRAILTRFVAAARNGVLGMRDTATSLAVLQPLQSDLQRAHTQAPSIGFADRATDIVSQSVSELAARTFDAAHARALRLIHGDDDPSTVPPNADDDSASTAATSAASSTSTTSTATATTTTSAALVANATAPTAAAAASNDAAYPIRARGYAIGDAIARLVEQSVRSLKPLFDATASSHARNQTMLLATKVHDGASVFVRNCCA